MYTRFALPRRANISPFFSCGLPWCGAHGPSILPPSPQHPTLTCQAHKRGEGMMRPASHFHTRPPPLRYMYSRVLPVRVLFSCTRGPPPPSTCTYNVYTLVYSVYTVQHCGECVLPCTTPGTPGYQSLYAKHPDCPSAL